MPDQRIRGPLTSPSSPAEDVQADVGTWVAWSSRCSTAASPKLTNDRAAQSARRYYQACQLSSWKPRAAIGIQGCDGGECSLS